MIPPSRSSPLVCTEKIAACSPMLHSVRKTLDKLFDRLENLTGQFVHSKPYNIFTPLTLGTDEPGWTFVKGYTTCPCAEHYLIKYKMASFNLVPKSLCYFCTADGLMIPVAVQKDRDLWERDWASFSWDTTHPYYEPRLCGTKIETVMVFTPRRSNLRPYTG